MPMTIKATKENSPFLRELIADWPELAQTINGLRHQGVFPGLRCMKVTLDDSAAAKYQCTNKHDFSKESKNMSS